MSTLSYLIRGDDEYKCYKVVGARYRSQDVANRVYPLVPTKLVSAVIDVPELVVQYKIGEFVRRPECGGGLLAFATLRDAEHLNRCIYPMGAIFEATGRGPMPLEQYSKCHTTISTKLADKPKILGSVDPFGWPEGSLMFEEIRLDQEYEYNGPED